MALIAAQTLLGLGLLIGWALIADLEQLGRQPAGASLPLVLVGGGVRDAAMGALGLSPAAALRSARRVQQSRRSVPSIDWTGGRHRTGGIGLIMAEQHAPPTRCLGGEADREKSAPGRSQDEHETLASEENAVSLPTTLAAVRHD